MKTFNKIVAITLGFAMVSGSLYAAPVAADKPYTPPTANLIKFNAIKMASAVIDSLKPLGRIVTNIMKISDYLEDPNFKKALDSMQPDNINKLLLQTDEKVVNKSLEEAYKNFTTIAPRIIYPTINIIEEFVKIIGKFGQAVINPQATIKGAPANEIFQQNIDTLNKMLKAVGALSLFTSNLPKPTGQELKAAAAESARTGSTEQPKASAGTK